MDSMHLLVADQSPESAEQINSLLRNSGIRIHAIHIQSCADLKRALDDPIDNHPPLIVLYGDVDPASAPAEEVYSLAQKHGVWFAFLTDVSEPGEWLDQLQTIPALVIHAAEPERLVNVVQQLVQSTLEARGFSGQKQQLDELEHRYDLLLDSARDAIAYVHEGLHVYANRAYREALHLDENHMLGLSILEVMDTGEVNLKQVLKQMSKGTYPDEPLSVTVKRPDNSQFEAELVFSPARFNGEDCIQMMVHEKDAHAEMAAELERIRNTDVLTGLANKNAFHRFLGELLAAEGDENSVRAVLYVETDGIRGMVEEHGDKEADEIVADLGGLIKTHLQSGDIAGRISDHGIALSLERGNKEDLEQTAEGLLRSYSNHIVELENRSFSATCSIGMVTLGRLSGSVEEVVAQARQAHGEATQKQESLIHYRPQLTAVTSDEDDGAWLERLRTAINNQDFYSVQQAIVDLDGEGEQLVENLTFMRDEDRNHAPSEYAEIAESMELAAVIDRHVIPGLLQTFADAEDRQVINLSNNSIMDFGFPAWFAEQLKLYAVDGNQIILQIALDAAQTNLKPAQMLMNELAPLGVKLSISGFNSERRTLQLLEHIDVAYIKLDAALTEDLPNNSNHQEEIRTIVDAADEKKTAVIAEEINDTNSLAILWQCGVKLIAGAFLKEDSQVVA